MVFFFTTVVLQFSMAASMSQPVRMFLLVLSAAVFIVCTGFRLAGSKRPDRLLLLQAAIFFVYGSAFLVFQSSAACYLLLAKISHVFTAGVGELMGKPLDLGMTYSGIHLILLFGIAALATGLYGGSEWKKILLTLASLPFFWAGYCFLWRIMAENTHALRLYRLEPLTGPLDFRLALFLFLLLAYCFVFRRELAAVKGAAPARTEWKGTGVTLGLFSLCLVIFVIPASPLQSEARGGNLLFWDTGISFTVPDYSAFGLDQVGMFGVLPEYLKRSGYAVKISGAVTEEELAWADALVVINPMRMTEKEELQRIHTFVEKGGGLLAAGDHTGMEQIREPLNAILSPAGISLRFDSAIPFKTLWADDFLLRKSALFQSVHPRQIQMVVGASLDLSGKAKPVLIGRGGFSDRGNPDNVAEGYLGDMRFHRGERIGDLILAAEATLAKGRIVALGDTTPLQNTVLAYSIPFVDNLFAYLTGNREKADGERGGESAYPAVLVVDMSHMERVAADKSGDAADGLIATALREGIMPFVHLNGDLTGFLGQSGLETVIFMEPAAELEEAEFIALDSFMAKGGRVILTGDYESPAATRALAARYGFDFDNMAIGRIAPSKNAEMALWNGCPLIYQGGLLREEQPDVEILMDVWGYAVIAQKTVGAGSVVLIADPDFLKNKNLEGSDSFREGNIRFVGDLLAGAEKDEGETR